MPIAPAALPACNEKLAIERIIAAAGDGGPERRKRALRSRAKERIAQTGLFAALLGVEGCLPVSGTDPIMVAPQPGAGGGQPSPPSSAPTPPERLSVGENRTTDIPVVELLEGHPGAASIVRILSVENGTAVLSGSIVQFTPNPGYEGPASITYAYRNVLGRTRRGKLDLSVDDTSAGDDDHADEDHGGGGDGGHDDGHGGDGGGGGDDDDDGHGDGGHPHDDDPAPTPHPDDPAKQAEHLALMNLVPVADATHVAVRSGSWFDPSVWANGEVPGEHARVVIPKGIAVGYDGESAVSIFTVRVDGALEFATDRDTHLVVDTLVVTPLGRLAIGTPDNPVEPGVEAVITIADNGPIDVAWDPMLLSRGVVGHGEVSIHGAEKESFLRVAVDPMRGATSLTLEEAPAGWQVGDRIVLTGTHLTQTRTSADDVPRTSDATEDEVLTITAINGNVITFDRPLQYDHEGARADLKAYVANYSRNVRIESENGASTPTEARGHVMFMHSDNVDVRYAEFFELGRTDKAERVFDTGDLASIAPDSNVKGRYALHIHRAGVGDLDDPVMIVGNAVWGSPGWGFVHHDSNAIFAANAAYDVFGAAFVAESGNETGRWADNISIKTIGVNTDAKDPEDIAAGDIARGGIGFYFQGRLVDAVGNVAAGSPGGHGFLYMHREPPGDMVELDDETVAQGEKLRFGAHKLINQPNIGIFDDNESIAVFHGLEVIKGTPIQGHDMRSTLTDFTAWEVYNAVTLQYTSHYTLKNFYLVATDQNLAHVDTAGLLYWTNVFDVVTVDARVEGFTAGVRERRESFFPNVTDLEYTFVDTTFAGNRVNFESLGLDGGRAAPDRILTSAQLPDLPLTYQSAHGAVVNGPDTWQGGEPSVELQGAKTDSLGRTQVSHVWDPFTANYWTIQGAVEANGYWTHPDGRKVTLIEEYVSDRVTGEVEKFAVWIDVPPVLTLPTYTDQLTGETKIAIDHGVLDLDNVGPIAANDAASVRAGSSVVIDVIANDRDPEGDPISLDAIFSERGHVVKTDDGKVAYFADPGFVGEDTFFYWAQDDQGNFTKAQVTVTVEI